MCISILYHPFLFLSSLLCSHSHPSLTPSVVNKARRRDGGIRTFNVKYCSSFNLFSSHPVKSYPQTTLSFSYLAILFKESHVDFIYTAQFYSAYYLHFFLFLCLPFFPSFYLFFHCYTISIALSCLLPSRKTLSWCKYPVWMNISWVEVVWLQAEFVCMCARACLCVLMHACVHTEAQVILRYLNSTHSNKTTGHAGNGNVIGLWQDAVCEQKPVCPTGVVSYTSTLTRTHKNIIITYTYTHTRSHYSFSLPTHSSQFLTLMWSQSGYF